MQTDLTKSIIDRLEKVDGDCGFYYKNLVSGDIIAKNDDELFLAASVIKLPILAVTFKLIKEGELSLFTKIKIKDSEKVPSCGAVRFFRGDLEIEVDTLCKTMITISDNTSTNALIRTIGIDRLNAEFKELSLEKTNIRRLLFDSEASKAGKQNRITARDMGMLLEKIYRHELIDSDSSVYMEDILLDQQINHKIPGYLPDEAEVAHKTGEDDGITNDVGIVYAKEPFIICFAFNNADVPEAERAIREISLMLYNENSK